MGAAHSPFLSSTYHQPPFRTNLKSIIQGLGRGDVGAIMMTNKPEYVVIELAMAKLGAVSALLNYNLKGEPLSHSIAVAGAKMVVFDDDLAGVIKPVVDKDPKKLAAVCLGPKSADLPWAVSLDKSLPNQPDTAPDAKVLADVSPNEPMSLVYTSGTTGLPKAAIIKHQRIFLTSMGFARQFAIRHSDRIYCTLPLYHSAGGNIGLGMMLNLGATLVLRSKFSASNFFKDVHDTNATVTQYIGCVRA
jgi:acyl-CoA synthetase (AMP-forming)/AMP-acid ligase II